MNGMTKSLVQVLPEAEKEMFLVNPVEFVSTSLLFRGLTMLKVKKLLQEECMQPECGRMGSVAVFLTNAPHFALTFATGSLPALAVVDPARVVLRNFGLLKPGTPEYQKAIQEAGIGRPGLSAYESQNFVDSCSTSVVGHSWMDYEMRDPQKLQSVLKLIVGTDYGVLIRDPSDPSHLEELRHIYR